MGSHHVQQSTVCFIEDPAFLRSYDSAPPPSLPHPPLLSLIMSLPVCRRSILLTEEGEGGWPGAKSYDREKAWPSIYQSILADVKYLRQLCRDSWLDESL